ncbi:MAG: AMP-binding protein, partial [Parasporobacterium sp.]|nr:AMP-binding protein [Parasporobacterium sp.]
MIRVTTDFLDRACANVPEKIGFEDKERTATYREVRDTSLKIALALDKVSHRGAEPQPVAILSDTNIDGMAMIHGVLYSGNYYAAIDTKSPADRIINTLKQMEPVAIVTSASNKALVDSLNWPCATVVLEECIEQPSDEQVSAWVDNIQPTDTSCVIFTSGSTGIPKGVEYDHRGVIGIMEAMCLDLDINSEDVVGNQSPIYYGMSTMNIFNSICAQAKLVLIPKVLFATPVPLLEYIIEKQISYVMWVPNIFATIAQFKAWEGLEEGLKCLKKLLFAG